MGSALGSLGIGLSVLFGVFLAALAAEIYYMLCYRSSGKPASRGLRLLASSRRVNSVQVADAHSAAVELGTAPPADVEWAPGWPLQSPFLAKTFLPASDDYVLSSPEEFILPSPFGFLFTIAEETKEEMDLLHSSGILTEIPSAGTTPHKLSTDKRSLSDSVVAAAVAGAAVNSLPASTSSSPSTSTDTPFVTPPTSPSPSDAPLLSRSASQSPSPSNITAVSSFSSVHSSPSNVAAACCPSRFSVACPSRFSVNSPSSAVNCRGSSSPVIDSSYIYDDHGTLSALFRRPYNSPSRYSPLRPAVWSRHITDFRPSLPFRPPSTKWQVFHNSLTFS